MIKEICLLTSLMCNVNITPLNAVNNNNSIEITNTNNNFDSLEFGQSYQYLTFKQAGYQVSGSDYYNFYCIFTNQADLTTKDQLKQITGDFFRFELFFEDYDALWNNAILMNTIDKYYSYCYIYDINRSSTLIQPQQTATILDNGELVRLVNYTYNGTLKNDLINIYRSNSTTQLKYNVNQGFNLINFNNLSTSFTNNEYYLNVFDSSPYIYNLDFYSFNGLISSSSSDKYFLTITGTYNNDTANLLLNYELDPSSGNLRYYGQPILIAVSDGGGGAVGSDIDYLSFTITKYTNGVYVPTTPNEPTTEVLDMNSLLFTILTLPFAFLSQAFNFTFFEGTPYAFNLSTIILSIISIAILIMIIKLIMSMIK